MLAAKGIPESARHHVAWHLALLPRDDGAAGARNLSLLWWDDGYEVYGSGDRVFVDGLGALTTRLAEGLDVRLGQAVQRVEHDADGVCVTTSRGGFEGERAIVTIPVGVLKADSVAFEPPLPERKRAAIGRIGMGDLTKNRSCPRACSPRTAAGAKCSSARAASSTWWDGRSNRPR